jgi:hypothetical protein
LRCQYSDTLIRQTPTALLVTGFFRVRWRWDRQRMGSGFHFLGGNESFCNYDPDELALRLGCGPLHIAIAELTAGEQRGNALKERLAQRPWHRACRRPDLFKLLVGKRHHCPVHTPITGRPSPAGSASAMVLRTSISPASSTRHLSRIARRSRSWSRSRWRSWASARLSSATPSVAVSW